jgi:hypothetical protein
MIPMFRVFWSVNLRGMKKSGLLGSTVNGVIQSKKNGPHGPAHDNVLIGNAVAIWSKSPSVRVWVLR